MTTEVERFVGPTAEMVSAVVTEVQHAISGGGTLEDAVRRGLEWGCWSRVWRPKIPTHVKSAAEMKADAARDTSCVGAFARARP